jgi:hypothetical protein
MSSSSDEPTDPFAAARRRPGVHVSLQVHDVQALRPHWNDERAGKFLDRFAAVIATGMLLAGTQVLRELLEAHEHEG